MDIKICIDDCDLFDICHVPHFAEEWTKEKIENGCMEMKKEHLSDGHKKED